MPCHHSPVQGTTITTVPLQIKTLVTFLESAFFLLVMMRRSSKRTRYISDGLPESSSVSGPSIRIWRRGDTISRSHGCFDSAALEGRVTVD